jgi:hypothetical protein
METTDYNGQGPWSRAAILERYARFAAGAQRQATKTSRIV